MKYYSIGEFAEAIGKTAKLLGIKGIEVKTKKVIGYCRVSWRL